MSEGERASKGIQGCGISTEVGICSTHQKGQEAFQWEMLINLHCYMQYRLYVYKLYDDHVTIAYEDIRETSVILHGLFMIMKAPKQERANLVSSTLHMPTSITIQ